jgi:hypothetical protein
LILGEFNFPSSICWRGCLFSIRCFWCLCKEKVDIAAWIHIWVLYYVPLVFISFFVLLAHAVFIAICATCTCCFYCYLCYLHMLFLLLLLCNIVWSQELWYLQCCSFGSALPWLFSLMCYQMKF